MNSLQELWAIFVALWNTGNRLIRYAILLMTGWSIAIAVIATAGSPMATAIVAMIPLVAGILMATAFMDPLVFALIGAFNFGRKAMKLIAAIIAAELVIGIYFSVVPVWNDKELIPVIVLIAVSIFFLVIGTRGKIQKTAVSAMTLVAIILTAIFFLGGREEAEKKFESSPPAPKRVVWTKIQTIAVPSEKWVEILLKFDGKQYKIAPDAESGAIETISNDKKYEIVNSFEQIDFGEIQSLKARSIKGNATVYIYVASYT